MIHPPCQLSPAVAQVGVPPVNALAVLPDMQMVTQLFRLMASILDRAMSLENSVVTLIAWLRTMNSLKFGSPKARMTPNTIIVTNSSMMVNPELDPPRETPDQSDLESGGFLLMVGYWGMGSV
ncbi:MAG: hypothetical protein Q8K24_09550 [Hydrogenophaga sp.]|nr:hypothetical protein [Hydrogenophaga sp.]